MRQRRMVVDPKESYFEDKITVWTEFQVLKSEKFTVKKWSDFFLLLRTTPGQRFSWWGPVLERQHPYNTMFLVQVYESREALSQFRESDQYEQYYSVLSEVSRPKVRLFRVDSLIPLLHSMSKGTALVTAYYPWPVRESQEDSITEELQTIWRGGRGMKTVHPSPMHSIFDPKLWAREPEERNGQKVQVMIWLHPWKDAEREHEYKRQKAFFDTRGRNLGVKGLTWMEKVHQGLEDTGAIEYVEEHCAFEYFPNPDVPLALARDRVTSPGSENRERGMGLHVLFSSLVCVALSLCLWRFCVGLA